MTTPVPQHPRVRAADLVRPRRRGDGRAPAMLFTHARAALYHAVRLLGVQPHERVLVPAYICESAVDAIEAHGAEVTYYAVTREGAPDLADLRARVDRRTRAVLLVHYFGFPQASAALREACDRAGLFLIEDCAHVLRGSVGNVALGAVGDASVFSWRKVLPVPDGGELLLHSRHAASGRVAPPSGGWVSQLRAAKHVLDDVVAEAGTPGLRRAYGWAERSLRRTRGGVAPVAEASRPAFAVFDRAMSWPSRWLLRHLDVDGIVASRKANRAFLEARLAGLEGVRLLTAPPDADVCPWVFPVMFEHRPNAHLALRAAGIPATTWSGVRPRNLRLGEFPDADDLYERLVHLPVHQGLHRAHLEAMVAAVRSLVARGVEPETPSPTWRR
jgi:perosamine synthetase